MKRILLVVGTRPEAIKLAPVVFALREHPGAEVVLCSSGQHRELLEQALAVFGLRPDLELGVMRPNQSLASLTAELVKALDATFAQQHPECVVVQGDTTTTLCASLAAYYRVIPVAHVEAGLRTRNLAAPFPEEANRQMVARIAALHFAPTESARKCLLDEGIANRLIHVTGNTVIDALEWIKAAGLDSETPPTLKPDIVRAVREGNPFILVTCHRREHFGAGLKSICGALRDIAARHPSAELVFPVHMNPNVRDAVHRDLQGIRNLRLIEPVDYRTGLWLLSRASLVLSDSGGIQEEAPSFGVPVVVMREHTERIEGLEQGFAVLAGCDPLKIVAATERILSDPELRTTLANRPNPYGDGRAAARIAALLAGGNSRP